MNPPRIEDLMAGLRARITDPARQQLVVELAGDIAQLQVRALAGEDVSRELLHCHAQAKSLTATEVGVITDQVMTWISGVAGAVVRGALVAAAAG